MTFKYQQNVITMPNRLNLPLFEMPIPQVYVVTTPTVNYLYADFNRPFHKNTNVYIDSTFISLNSQLDLLSHWITSVEFYSGPERRVWKKRIFLINILT